MISAANECLASGALAKLQLRHLFAYEPLDGRFCREVLVEALEKFGRPEWFNTDQGAQYTCLEFITILEDTGIQISMDGRGRALDNIWIERFWRTIKYEEVYPKSYVDGRDALQHLAAYFYLLQ